MIKRGEILPDSYIGQEVTLILTDSTGSNKSYEILAYIYKQKNGWIYAFQSIRSGSIPDNFLKIKEDLGLLDYKYSWQLTNQSDLSITHADNIKLRKPLEMFPVY